MQVRSARSPNEKSRTMSLLDKAKETAKKGVDKAKEVGQAGQDKFEQEKTKRKISDEELFVLMRMSEQQVFDWQQSRPAGERSSLLNTYFRFFPAR